MRRLRMPSDLGYFARAVIGLTDMGICEEETIASLLYRPSANLPIFQAISEYDDTVARVAEFLGVSLDSDHPVMEYVNRNGLPACCAAPLPDGYSVRCPECGGNVSSVPCVKCVPCGVEDLELCPSDAGLDEMDDIPLKRPKESTCAYPGTPEKVEVMAMRVRLGFSPFHPEDAKLRL